MHRYVIKMTPVEGLKPKQYIRTTDITGWFLSLRPLALHRMRSGMRSRELSARTNWGAARLLRRERRRVGDTLPLVIVDLYKDA